MRRKNIMALVKYTPPTDPWIEIVFEDADRSTF